MNIYILETGSAQSDGSIFFYTMEVYSSLKKLKDRINNSVDINKGYNIKEYTFLDKKRFDYTCISTDGRPMDIFLRYGKVLVK